MSKPAAMAEMVGSELMAVCMPSQVNSAFPVTSPEIDRGQSFQAPEEGNPYGLSDVQTVGEE